MSEQTLSLLDVLEVSVIQELGRQIGRFMAKGEFHTANVIASTAMGLAFEFVESGISGTNLGEQAPQSGGLSPDEAGTERKRAAI